MTESAASRNGCPPWCNDHEDKSGQHHRGRTLEPGGIVVELRQIANDPRDSAALYVHGLPIRDPSGKLGRIDVMSMARLMRRLGREDVAIAVEQMATVLRVQ